MKEKCKFKDCRKSAKYNKMCKKHKRITDNMRCGICKAPLKIFLGNPNKKKDRMRNFCSRECATKAGFIKELEGST